MKDVLQDSFSLCESRGPTMALHLLTQRIPPDRVESNEYLRALFDAYRSASTAEKSRMKRAIEDLAGFGVGLPRDLLFLWGCQERSLG